MCINEIVKKDNNSPKGQEKKGKKTVSDERLMQFIGTRFGQRPETRERYDKAVQACKDIDYLDMTIGGIAHMFGHTDQCLRNHLQRHYPELLKKRELIRVQLGLNKRPLRGVSDSTAAKYAPAVEMLRTSDMTISEVAKHFGMNTHALQQHVLYHHRDVARQRMEKRLQALDQRATGGMSGTGRPNAPRKATEELYTEAVEMYRTTDLTVPEIALKCGVMVHNFQTYLQRWCRSDIEVRRKLRQEKLERQQQERAEMGDRSRSAMARQRYMPAVKLIEEGATYEEAAEKLGLNAENLYRWVKEYLPDVHRQEYQNQIVQLPEGTTCTKESWAKFGEAATAYCETDESMNSIARRFGLSPTSFCHFLARKFPQAVARRNASPKPHTGTVPL